MSLSSSLGALMEGEIREQPAVVRRILAEGMGPIRDAAVAIRARAPRLVIFLARGSSDNAAVYAKYLFETLLGIPCGLAAPSTVTVYGSRMRLEDTLVIAFSQSGESPDLVQFLEQANADRALTLAITNESGSPLEETAQLHIPMLAGPELSVAATKTYSAELLVAYLLVTELADAEDGQLGRLASMLEDTLTCESQVQMVADSLRFAQHALLTSRGYNFATVLEGALKLVETANLPAHAFSSADLMHGPVAMVDSGFPAIAVVPPGPGGSSVRTAVAELRNRGVDPFVFASSGPNPINGAIEVPEVTEPLSPIVLIVPLQLLALHLARSHGVDADAPRGLSKVTRTV